MDWDEMEKQAEEEDRRAAVRRQTKDAVPVPVKKRSVPGRR